MEEAKSNRVLIGKRIKELREKRGLYQEDFANTIGSKRSAISNYESGTAAPQPYMLAKIATALNTTVDYIVGRTNDPANNEVDPQSRKINLLDHRTYDSIVLDDQELSEQEIDLLITFIRTLRNSK